MRSLLVILSLSFSTIVFSQSADEIAIRKVMQEQQDAWNNYDIEGFMQGYWKSDSLQFYSRGYITKGWQQTLDNYKKNYTSKEQTGQLTFKLNAISPIETGSYYIMGEYHLKRTVGDAQGEFIIIFKKIDGQWKIIADMST
ncbi:DUF4440 domain-containing protein [Hanstruepera neustonica]|uniref:DUF4440 domain-containing protein n=1 Tax=Hanstruepera neustonica TaxID=1445657 RepID=A0A2K1E4C6_9FLAO|nr:DUF4440 domain-containing protein [Hanstruepera neustonica]PNQ75135.1 DUF4440 domain-containing protein [Hanstruepera neustonica]